MPMGDNSCSDCHLRWNPSVLTRKDDACDASTPPDNGGVGNCTDTLVSGTSCVPTCNPGYVLQGATSCTNRVLTEAACVWPIANGTELKAAVDACLDAVPLCCSSDPRCWYDDTAMRRCGALGCSDMPDWDVSQVMDAQNLFAGRSSFYQDVAGWTFSDDAITTGMFTGAEPGSPLNRAQWVRFHGRSTWRLDLHPVPGERARETECAHPALVAGPEPPETTVLRSATRHATFPDRAALKTAVDNCLAVDATGVACCMVADCGAAGTAEMPLGRFAGDGHEQLVQRQRTSSTRTYRGGTSARSATEICFIAPTSSTRTYRGGTSARSDIEMRHMIRNTGWDVSSVTNMYYMFLTTGYFKVDNVSDQHAVLSGGHLTFKWYRMFYSARAAFTARIQQFS